MKPITYEHDDKGNIVLPTEAPFDGNPCLIKTSNGWVEACYEYDSYCWSCLTDDVFEEELDGPKFWAPLPSEAQS